MIFRYQWSPLVAWFFCFLLAAPLLFLAVQFSEVFGWTGISHAGCLSVSTVHSECTLQHSAASSLGTEHLVQVFTQPGCEQGQVMPDDPSKISSALVISSTGDQQHGSRLLLEGWGLGHLYFIFQGCEWGGTKEQGNSRSLAQTPFFFGIPLPAPAKRSEYLTCPACLKLIAPHVHQLCRQLSPNWLCPSCQIQVCSSIQRWQLMGTAQNIAVHTFFTSKCANYILESWDG